MMVTVGIVAMLGAMAIPWFQRTMKRNRLAGVARDLVGHVMQMRAEASSGRVISTGPLVKVRGAGLLLLSDEAYVLFSDTNTTNNGDETTIRTVDYGQIHIDNQITFIAPAANTELRFHADGSVEQPTNFTMREAILGIERTVQVNAVGHVRMRDTTIN